MRTLVRVVPQASESVYVLHHRRLGSATVLGVEVATAEVACVLDIVFLTPLEEHLESMRFSRVADEIQTLQGSRTESFAWTIGLRL